MRRHAPTPRLLTVFLLAILVAVPFVAGVAAVAPAAASVGQSSDVAVNDAPLVHDDVTVHRGGSYVPPHLFAFPFAGSPGGNVSGPPMPQGVRLAEDTAGMPGGGVFVSVWGRAPPVVGC